MFKQFTVFIALFAFCGSAAASENEMCYSTFHQTKDMDCVEGLLETVHKSAESWNKQPQTMPAAITGFLAEIFTSYEEEKKDILDEDVPTDVAGIYLAALLRAGLNDDARQYAEKVGLVEGLQKYEEAGVPTLKEIKPHLNPAENDLLIGAYMASGNTEYITAILDNYTNVKEGMASDAFRIAMVTGKFGPMLTPPGRENTIAPAACKKYACKTNPKKFQHVLTLASAFWATRALAGKDETAKGAVLGFFNENPDLKELLTAEKTAFADYVGLLTAYASVKDNAGINSALSAYENMRPAKDVASAVKKIKAPQAEE